MARERLRRSDRHLESWIGLQAPFFINSLSRPSASAIEATRASFSFASSMACLLWLGELDVEHQFVVHKDFGLLDGLAPNAHGSIANVAPFLCIILA